MTDEDGLISWHCAMTLQWLADGRNLTIRTRSFTFPAAPGATREMLFDVAYDHCRELACAPEGSVVLFMSLEQDQA